MKKLFLFFYLLILHFILHGQKITGHVFDASGKPQEFATVMLMQAKDSALVKGALTEAAGNFEIDKPGKGRFFLNISCVGFKNYYTQVFDFEEIKDVSFDNIKLVSLDKELNAVTVTARKPTFEMKADMMVMNVDANVNNVGNNAIELLRKAPGVLVDKDENVSLKGKSGVRIYIDGKPSPLSGQDLVTILRGLNASDIEAIEIITNPSAKYDAAGNAGIINIRLKKNRKIGTNGNASVGFGYGQSPKYNAGLNLNYRNKKTNIFGNYSFRKNRWDEELYLVRRQNGLIFDQSSPNYSKGSGHNLKGGVDYFIDSKNTLGVLITGNLNDEIWATDTRTLISTIGKNKVDSVLIARNEQPQSSTNMTYNINYRFADTSGHELNVDADYGHFIGKSASFLPNYYKTSDESRVLNTRIYRNNMPTDLTIKTFKADYEQNLFKGKLGFGFKISDVKSDNTFDFYNVINDASVKDDALSNRFTYNEMVNAAYLNYNRPLSKKVTLQAGLRGEHTKSLGKLQAVGQSNNRAVDTSYFNLFPSGALSFNISKNYALNVSYSRRIERPRYQELNPFEFKLDELTYKKGNPFLRPAFTQSLEVNHTIMQAINVGTSYSYQKDVIADLIDTTELTRTFQISKNIASQRNFSINVSSPLPITKWWEGFINIWMNHAVYKSANSASFNIDANYTQFGFYCEQTLKFGKGWSGQVSGWWNSPSIWGGMMRMNAQGMMDVGVQKKLMNDQATLKVSFGDVFNTSSWSGRTLAGADLKIRGGWEGQVLRLNFNYRFGSNEIKGARERRTGMEDEKSRVKSGKN